MKKKTIILFSILILLGMFFIACKKNDTKQSTNDISSEPTAAPTVTEAADVSPSPYDGLLAGSMTKEDYPVVDGSTATIPLSEAVYELATGATPEEAAKDIVHTKTSNSYYRLMNKEVDLLIVYAPSEQVLADIEKGGNQLDIKPIGKDALVFMANSSNTVDTLTHEQLVDIYSGKITNWSKVGGVDKEILAFQRPENSGSQTLMQKLVMGDTPMMTGKNVISYESMEGILKAMVDYTNEGNTLGYSVYYYAQNMYQLPELKFMKVNGIEPSLETIYDNSYPYINEFYAVIRKDEPASSNAHKIFDWLSGKEGQTLVKNLGYVPVSMGITEKEVTNEPQIMDKIPDGYRYIAASYSNEDGITKGTITIYKGEWEPVREFKNAFVQPDPGLVKEDSKKIIGYAIEQEDGSFSMKDGLYDLKTDEFVIPAEYDDLFELDVDRGYYVAKIKDEYKAVDSKGNVLTTGLNSGEGFGFTKEGDYYWLYDYSTGQEKHRVYDQNFNLVKEFVRNYELGEFYEPDGTVYFNKDIFMKHFGFKAKKDDEFYCQSYDVGSSSFVVFYNGTSYVLDRELNILAQKPVDENNYSYYNVYDGIFSDSYYNSETFTEDGYFCDNKGNIIADNKGNPYTNIVSDNYWKSKDNGVSEQLLYEVTDHILKIFNYGDKSNLEIDLGDWENITINYVNKDIVVVQKTDTVPKTRIYKGNKLLIEKAGYYFLASLNNTFHTNNILLINYDYEGLKYSYMLLNSEGKLVYESPYPENILSIDDKYIQLNRGNYWGVMNHEGEFLIKGINNDLGND